MKCWHVLINYTQTVVMYRFVNMMRNCGKEKSMTVDSKTKHL